MTAAADGPAPEPLDAGRKALEILGEVLAKKPQKDDHALSEATQKLCVYRQRLIEAARAGHETERAALSRLNAILSIVAGVHFPLGDIPWDELDKARASLAELLDAARQPAPG